MVKTILPRGANQHKLICLPSAKLVHCFSILKLVPVMLEKLSRIYLKDRQNELVSRLKINFALL